MKVKNEFFLDCAGVEFLKSADRFAHNPRYEKLVGRTFPTTYEEAVDQLNDALDVLDKASDAILDGYKLYRCTQRVIENEKEPLSDGTKDNRE